jgi:hypothetical protein
MSLPARLCDLLHSACIQQHKLSCISREKNIQELRVTEGLLFLDAWKKFHKTKPKTGTQSHATALQCLQEVDAITQTEVILSKTKQSPTAPNNNILVD